MSTSRKTISLRINQRPTKYWYAVLPEQAKLIKLLGLLGLLALVSTAWGYFNFLNLSLVGRIVLSLPFAIIVAYFFINNVLLLFFRGFDIDRHNEYVKEFWSTEKEPSVAVLIPAAGEAVDLVRNTVRAAMEMDYKNKTVYILDDTADAQYLKLIESLGCKHINRPDVGVKKKAGNLNYGLENITHADWVFVLDADFVPRKEALKELVPYATGDVAIVQSPQHFRQTDSVYYDSKIEFGAGMIQRDFYRIVQVARDRFDSAICVGTNALYNREAIREVGGFEGVGGKGVWQHSEDVNTGLKIINTFRKNGQPYRIKYVPVQLATGLCPRDYYSLYKQQSRWATGSFRLMFARKTLFSRVLRPSQKFAYFSNALYYFYTIALLITPVMFMILVLSHGVSSWKYTAFFIPQILVSLVITPFVLRREPEPFAGMVILTANAYTFLHAMTLAILRKPIGWEATGNKSLPTNKKFTEYKLLVSFYFLVFYGGAMAFAILNNYFGLQHKPTILLQLFFLYGFIAQVIHLAYLYLWSHKNTALFNRLGLGITLGIVLLFAVGSFIERPHYHLFLNSSSKIQVISVNTVASSSKKKTQQPVATTASVSSTTNVKNSTATQSQAPTMVSYTVQAGDSQTSIVRSEIYQIDTQNTLSSTQVAYTETNMVDAMGNNNLIIPGQVMTINLSQLNQFINDSKNLTAQQLSSWAQYSSSIPAPTSSQVSTTTNSSKSNASNIQVIVNSGDSETSIVETEINNLSPSPQLSIAQFAYVTTNMVQYMGNTSLIVPGQVLSINLAELNQLIDLSRSLTPQQTEAWLESWTSSG